MRYPRCHLPGLVTIALAIQLIAAQTVAPIALAASPREDQTPLISQSTTAMIGGVVWIDKSRNGLQGGTERGFSGSLVALLDATLSTLAATVTDATGHYTFTDLSAGTYRVAFTRPDDFVFTEQEACGALCGSVDSDANADTGLTDMVELAEGQRILTIAAGLVQIRFRAFAPFATSSIPWYTICNSSTTPWWRQTTANTNYTFCVKQDLEFKFGCNSYCEVTVGQDRDLTMWWNVWGIGGIRLGIDGNGSCSGGLPGGSGITGRHAVNGQGDGGSNAVYPLNARDIPRGGYKLELYIINQQGQEVGYNEKFICVR